MSHNLRSLTVIFTHFLALMVAVGFLPSIPNPAFAALPDLTVQSFSVKPREVKAGGLLTISVTVKNAGTKRAPSSWVALFGTTEAAKDLINAMGPVSLNGGPLARNATATVIFRITVPSVTPGVYAIYAKVDPERLVAESRENNNVIALGKVTLLSSSEADLSVPSFSVAPSAVTAGDVLTVAATVKNIGTKDAPSSWVALFGTTATATDLAEAMGPASLDGGPLAPNASATVTFSITVPSLTPGEYTIYAKVDPNQLVAESRESNNISAFAPVTLNPPHPPPPPTAGTIYYVAAGGSDGNPGTDTLPFRTISYAVSRLAPGETLLVKNGTYAESLIHSIPPGTSWDSPVTVAAYPGHTVILRPPAGAEFVLRFTAPQAYIIVDGLILDGVNVTLDVVKITETSGMSAHHIRIQHCEVMNSKTGMGILISGANTVFNEILFNKIHHNGNVYDGGDANHGIYLTTDHNLIEGNELYEHRRGYGIHLFGDTQSFNRIIRNWVHDNSDGMDIHGDGNLVALNLVWNHGIGINLGNSGSVQGGNEIYQNTMYRNEGAVSVRAGVLSTRIINNIVQASSGYPANSILDHGGINTQIEHNVLDRSVYKSDYSVPPAGTNLYNTNALLVNPTAFDFHLQPASPAIGAGMDIPEVPTDFDFQPWTSPRSTGAFR